MVDFGGRGPIRSESQAVILFQMIENGCAMVRFGVCVVLSVVTCGAVKADTMYATDLQFPPSLRTVDTGTGAATQVGSGYAAGTFISGLAFDVNSQTLFGIDFSGPNELFSIDTTTGDLTVVGNTNLATSHALAFDPNTDTLFASNGSMLFTINTITAATTSIGAFGFSSVLGLAFDPNTNTLFGSDGSGDQLLTINTGTGAASSVGALGFGRVAGLTYDPLGDILYGVSDDTQELISIDTTTGSGTLIGELVPGGNSNVEALAFGYSNSAAVPEPSTFAAMGLGFAVAGAGWLRRKRKTLLK